MDKKRNRMSPWRLTKKGRHSGSVWDQPFPRQTVSCGSPCQRTATSARRMASSSPRRSGDTASTPHTVPLRETLQHCPNVTLRVPWRKRETSLPPFYGRRNRDRGHRSGIKIQSRSTRLSDSQTLFMGTHHPPRTARVFSAENEDLALQRLRDILLSQKQHVCYLYELVETEDI